MSDARDEAVEVGQQAVFDHAMSWSEAREAFACACGFESDQMDAPERHMSIVVLDALTKPRTETCEVCDGQGADWGACIAHAKRVGGILRSDDPADYMPEHPCPPCSGSGTVTRGPIAVLVDELERVLDHMNSVWADDPDTRPVEYDDDGDALPRLTISRITKPAYLYRSAALDALYRRTGEG